MLRNILGDDEVKSDASRHPRMLPLVSAELGATHSSPSSELSVPGMWTLPFFVSLLPPCGGAVRFL
eukprot:4991061-Prymnesium_polylepis.1